MTDIRMFLSITAIICVFVSILIEHLHKRNIIKEDYPQARVALVLGALLALVINSVVRTLEGF